MGAFKDLYIQIEEELWAETGKRPTFKQVEAVYQDRYADQIDRIHDAVKHGDIRLPKRRNKRRTK